MPKIGTDALLAVKYANGWAHLRVNPYRRWEAIVRYFQSKPDLRFAILWKYNRVTRRWEEKLGYFDRFKDEFYGRV